MVLAMAQNEHVKPCLRATDTRGNFIMKIRRTLRVGERHAGKYIRGVTGLKRWHGKRTVFAIRNSGHSVGRGEIS